MPNHPLTPAQLRRIIACCQAETQRRERGLARHSAQYLAVTGIGAETRRFMHQLADVEHAALAVLDGLEGARATSKALAPDNTGGFDWAIAKDGKVIAEAFEHVGYASDGITYDKQPAEANARLIAAAPELLAALEGIMVGGNHLALLIGADHPPYTAEPLAALEHYGAGDTYEVWCCWRAIMQARDVAARATGAA
jgi:hypothetical protein